MQLACIIYCGNLCHAYFNMQHFNGKLVLKKTKRRLQNKGTQALDIFSIFVS